MLRGFCGARSHQRARTTFILSETALDGSEGATLVCRHPYDLIFCDLRMPEMDGRGLYKEIRLLCPRVLKRLVFVTALARSPDYAPFLRETGMPVLPKPFTIHQLRGVLARMVGPEIQGEQQQRAPSPRERPSFTLTDK